MVIDEWGGWAWCCFHCDHIDREATPEEIEQHEKGFYKSKKGAKARD